VSYEVDLWKEGEPVGKGYLDAMHLTDHPGALEALQEAFQVLSLVFTFGLEARRIRSS
jgi:hypothetical protein